MACPAACHEGRSQGDARAMTRRAFTPPTRVRTPRPAPSKTVGVTAIDPQYNGIDVDDGETFSDTINGDIDPAIAAQQDKGGE